MKYESYAEAEQQGLQAACRNDEDLVCPRCSAVLVSELLAGGGTIPPVWEVSCHACRLATMVARGR